MTWEINVGSGSKIDTTVGSLGLPGRRRPDAAGRGDDMVRSEVLQGLCHPSGASDRAGPGPADDRRVPAVENGVGPVVLVAVRAKCPHPI